MIAHLRSQPQIPLGTYGRWPLRRTLSLSVDAIKTHTHIIGKSGGGKSRALASLYLNLLKAGLSATVIDPHTDLARLILRQLIADGVYQDPDDETPYERIIYLDLSGAARQGWYLPFNPLSQPYDSHTTCRNLLEALRRAWPALADGRAPQFENLVLAGSYVLLRNQRPFTLLHELLVNKTWRDQLLPQVDDDQIVSFFRHRFDKWAREQATMIESTLRRVFLLSFTPIQHNMLGQPGSALNFPEILNRGQSVIINLGGLDADSKKLLGCLLTVGYETAALARADLPAEQRYGSHHLILDEFSLFSATSEETFSGILSECRKYHLYLTLAHQTFSQTSARLQGALGNCGIRKAFKLSRSDAEYAASVFGRPSLERVKHQVEDSQAQQRSHPLYVSLPEQWEEWIQALQDLKQREAFILDPQDRATKITTLPMPDPVVDPAAVRRVEETYLKRYFTPLADIEAERARLRPEETTPSLGGLHDLRGG